MGGGEIHQGPIGYTFYMPHRLSSEEGKGKETAVGAQVELDRHDSCHNRLHLAI